MNNYLKLLFIVSLLYKITRALACAPHTCAKKNRYVGSGFLMRALRESNESNFANRKFVEHKFIKSEFAFTRRDLLTPNIFLGLRLLHHDAENNGARLHCIE